MAVCSCGRFSSIRAKLEQFPGVAPGKIPGKRRTVSMIFSPCSLILLSASFPLPPFLPTLPSTFVVHQPAQYQRIFGGRKASELEFGVQRLSAPPRRLKASVSITEYCFLSLTPSRALRYEPGFSESLRRFAPSGSGQRATGSGL